MEKLQNNNCKIISCNVDAINYEEGDIDINDLFPIGKNFD